MRMSLLSVLFVSSLLSCATRPSLLDYPPKSTAEQQVLRIISEFEKAANAYDAQRLYALYAPEATVQTSTKKGSLKWGIFNREEWFVIVQRRFQESYVGSGLAFTFFEPENLVIEKDKARVTIPYELSSLQMNYSETGFFKFELEKTISDWTITKFRYRLLTSNHSDWPEYQMWLKKQK